MSYTVRFYVDSAGKHRWHLWGGGNLVADSGQGYATKSNARRAWRRIEAQIRAGVAVDS